MTEIILMKKIVKLHYNMFREGDVKALNLLLENSSDVWNTVSNNGRTPLHTAGRLDNFVMFM